MHVLGLVLLGFVAVVSGCGDDEVVDDTSDATTVGGDGDGDGGDGDGDGETSGGDSSSSGTGDGGTGDGGDGDRGDGNGVSFAEDIQPLFTAKCGPACHIGGASGGLSLAMAYDNIVNVASSCGPPYVDAGAADESFLFAKVTGQGIPAGCGAQMPLGRTPLTDGEIQLLRDWIDGSAPNN